MRVTALISSIVLIVMLVLSFGLLWLNLAFATAAVLLGSFACWGHVTKHRRTIGYALVGAILVGAVGFVVGYFRPDVFGVEGNLAPLVGVFVASPIGFVSGAVMGLVAACVLGRRRPASQQGQQSMKSGA